MFLSIHTTSVAIKHFFLYIHCCETSQVTCDQGKEVTWAIANKRRSTAIGGNHLHLRHVNTRLFLRNRTEVLDFSGRTKQNELNTPAIMSESTRWNPNWKSMNIRPQACKVEKTKVWNRKGSKVSSMSLNTEMIWFPADSGKLVPQGGIITFKCSLPSDKVEAFLHTNSEKFFRTKCQ